LRPAGGATRRWRRLLTTTPSRRQHMTKCFTTPTARVVVPPAVASRRGTVNAAPSALRPAEASG
jgi:hypothetical protein